MGRGIAAAGSVLAVLALAGCGGGSDQSGTAPDRGSAPDVPTTGAEASPSDNKKSLSPSSATSDQDSGQLSQTTADQGADDNSRAGAAGLEVKGGDNSIQRFGSEATGSDFDQAAAALHGYLDARAEGEWQQACAHLAPGLAAQMQQLGGAQAKGVEAPSCPQLLASLSGGIPPQVLREAALADVVALRLQGQSGFLLFHGARDTDFFIPMSRREGEWRVAAIAPSPLQ